MLANDSACVRPLSGGDTMTRAHKQDRFDGGRAANLTNPVTPPNYLVLPPATPEDDEQQALTFAMLAPSESGDLSGD